MVLSRTALRTAAERGAGLGADVRCTTVIRSAALCAAPHVAAWIPFIYAAIRDIQLGWRPVSDNAAIALRSWDVLSAHAPLVGQSTRLAPGVYDPGPLQYWLLTLPVHLDPLRGVRWGAALWCMLAASLTIGAARSVAGRCGSLVAVGVIFGAIAWVPAIVVLPSWNPWFGMMFFLMALATALAVMTGRRRWWPVLVVAGSIAAQAHLMFSIGAAGLVIMALAVGLADSYRAKAGYWWAIAGLIVGLVSWSAPLVQQFTSRQGNLGALIQHKGAVAPTAGLPFGLKALASATAPPPLWWQPLESLGKLSLIEKRSAMLGAAVLLVVAVILVMAIYLFRARWLAALASISLLVSITALPTYSGVPLSSINMTTSRFDDLRYLMTPMFAVGILSWLAVASALVLGAKLAIDRARAPTPGPGSEQAGTAQDAAPAPAASAPAALPLASPAPAAATTARARWARWAARAAGFAAVALIALAALLTVTLVPSAQGRPNPVVDDIGLASRQIEQKVPHRPIELLVVASDNHFRRQLTFGLVYALRVVGYRPEIRHAWAFQLGSIYGFKGKPMPHVTIYQHRDGGLSVTITDGSGTRRS